MRLFYITLHDPSIKMLKVRLTLMKKRYGNYLNKIAEYCLSCQLGGFHLQMLFVDGIGTYVKGSGLEKVEQSVYGSRKQMAKEREIARSVCVCNFSKNITSIACNKS